jgi:hypothetical protein
MDDVMKRILGIGEAFAVPFAQKIVFGGDRASEMAMAREKAAINRLNGSGAPDEAGNLALPRSERAKKDDASVANRWGSMLTDPKGIALMLVVGVAAIFIAKKLFK